MATASCPRPQAIRLMDAGVPEFWSKCDRANRRGPETFNLAPRAVGLENTGRLCQPPELKNGFSSHTEETQPESRRYLSILAKVRADSQP